MTSLNVKNFEKQFNEYWSKLIYAVFDDIQSESAGAIKYSPLMYQTYANLVKDKKDRVDNVKNRFTVSDQVRQHFTFLFGKMINELKNIQIVDGDTVDTIRAKLETANTECYAEFMYGVGAILKPKFGKTLQAAGDPSRWFHNQLIGFLPQYATKPIIIALLSTEFDMFLKAIAWHIGQLITYHEVSISSEIFLGSIAQLGLNQLMRDVLQSQLRAKPPTKPRAKKEPSAATPVTTPTDTITHPPVTTPTTVGVADLEDMLVNV